MNKKILKIFVLIIIMIFSVNIKKAYSIDLGHVIQNGKVFINSGSGTVSVDNEKLKETSSSIYNILLMISFVVVAIVGITLGIKFMMSGVEEKAEVKKSLIIFIIGCIVAYGSFGIWRTVVTFLNTL